MGRTKKSELIELCEVSKDVARYPVTGGKV